MKNGPVDERTDRSRMTAYLSDDDGQTWYGGLVLDERNEVSYPDATQADDGTIFVIYDRSRYKEKEILLARFSEEDIIAGTCISDKAMMRTIVNKAFGDPARITFSPDGGNFPRPCEVRLNYPIHGPWVYYTLDGTEPTRQSIHYTEPILIRHDTVLKAKAIGGKGGQHQSPISTAIFKIAAD